MSGINSINTRTSKGRLYITHIYEIAWVWHVKCVNETVTRLFQNLYYILYSSSVA